MKRTVLVVEDTDALRIAICRLLEHFGLVAVGVDTGSAALDVLSCVPDVVLLDLMLPIVSGEDVLRSIREKMLPTRVVVMTATPDETRLGRVRQLNPDAILAKPMVFEDLLGTILNCVSPSAEGETPRELPLTPPPRPVVVVNRSDQPIPTVGPAENGPGEAANGADPGHEGDRPP